MTGRKIKGSAEEKAYQSIIGLIINQQYPPGTPLPETQVSEEIGMSRTPVRNALRRLIADGFLDSSFNRSARVPSLSSKDLQSLFDLRLLLEPKAAYEAAANVSAHQKDVFDQLIVKEKEGYYQRDPDLYKINEQIHFGIAALSENVYLERAIKPVFWRSELYVFFFDNLYMGNDPKSRLRDPEKSISHKAHCLLIEAIFQNDSQKAEKVMREHILSTKKGLTNNANYR
jgi:DNA-binding GntR family transcriptional regulator